MNTYLCPDCMREGYVTRQWSPDCPHRPTPRVSSATERQNTERPSESFRTMTLNEYQIAALRTAPVASADHDLLHAVMGLVTETGELMDALKKQHAYGKPLDLVNLREEAGDVLWYLPLLCRALGVSLETVAETNIAKLRARYPEKFTSGHALNRDLETERKILEGKDAA